MNQQIGCMTMAIGVVVMLIYSLAQGVYDFISGLWIHTLLPFFHGPVWAIIAIGIATFFGYALYLSEVEPEKEAADDHGMQSAGDDSANVAQGALPQVPPQQVPMVNPLTPPPQNGQPQASTGQSGTTQAPAPGPILIRSYETGASSQVSVNSADQGKAGNNQ